MIFVTGCARSGTTLITRMLEACGAELGQAGGLAEHMPFKNKVLKPYLKRMGADPLGQTPLPDTDNLLDYPEIKADIEAVTSDTEIVKDVKTALIWPVLHEAFPDAKWLIVHRSPEKIAESCLRTSFMSKLSTKAEWIEWAEHYHSLNDDIRENCNSMTIQTSKVIDDVWTLEPVINWLGLEFDDKKVKKTIVKDRWHGDATA